MYGIFILLFLSQNTFVINSSIIYLFVYFKLETFKNVKIEKCFFFSKSKESNIPTAEETRIYVLMRSATSDSKSFNVILLTSSGYIMSLHELNF